MSTISKPLNIALWIVQGFLAFILIYAGGSKLFALDSVPYPWVKEQPGLVVPSAIGDLLCAFGLLLPGIFNIKPKLTLYAAYGLTLLMLIATGFHLMRGESSVIGFNIFLLLLCGFVIWGRRK